MEAFNKMTQEEQKKILDSRIASKKVRCKNWPSCKDPNCIFAHPTETVSLYNIYIMINFNSALIFLLVIMEISAAIFILVFLVNLVIIVRELDAHIPIRLDLILEWQCTQI